MRKIASFLLFFVLCAMPAMAQQTMIMAGKNGTMVDRLVTDGLGHLSVTLGGTTPTTVLGTVRIVDSNGNALLNTDTATVLINASSTGGADHGSWLSDNSSVSQVVKASAGNLKTLTITNLLAAAMYVRAYNTTSANCGSATGIKDRWIIPANAAGSGANLEIPPEGIYFDTGITLCFTTTVGDTNTTAIAANSAAATYSYK